MQGLRQSEAEPIIGSPAIVVSYVASVLGMGVPLFLAYLMTQEPAVDRKTILSAVTVLVGVLAGFLWSAAAYRALQEQGDSPISVQGLRDQIWGPVLERGS